MSRSDRFCLSGNWPRVSRVDWIKREERTRSRDVSTCRGMRARISGGGETAGHISFRPVFLLQMMAMRTWKIILLILCSYVAGWITTDMTVALVQSKGRSRAATKATAEVDVPRAYGTQSVAESGGGGPQ